MKKTAFFLLTLLGAVTAVFAVHSALQTALTMVMSLSFRYEGQTWDYFLKWLGYYSPLLAGGVCLCAVGCGGLWLLRARKAPAGMYAFILMGTGAMLAGSVVMEGVKSALYNKNLSYSWVDPDTPFRVYFYEAARSDLVMALVGLVLLALGVVLWLRQRHAEAPEAEQEEAPAAVETPVPAESAPQEPVFRGEEMKITLYCTVMDIRGDYALIKYDTTGIESEVALALLPYGVDTGDKLKYENYEFNWI